MKLKYIIMVLLLFGFASGASANTISFNPVTNVITITGFNATHPCSFLDVYNADVAGGWGKINQITALSYYINGACFYLGNITHNGYFGDKDKLIVAKMPRGKQFLFNSEPHRGYLEFGAIHNATLKTAHRGCDFTLCEGSSSGMTDFCNNPRELYLYGCKIQREIFGYGWRLYLLNTNGSIWQTHFNNGCYFQYAANNLSLYDVTWSNTGVMSFQYSSKISVEKIQIYNANQALALYGKSSYTYNLYARNINRVAWVMRPLGHHYIIDADIDWNKGFSWMMAGGWGVYRQYTCNIQTTPNAKITIMNHTDIVYQGYADNNGLMKKQLLTMGHYERIYPYDDSLQSQNPYSIEIKKRGYHTYKQKFILSTPIKWNIRLVPDRIEVGSDIIRANRR